MLIKYKNLTIRNAVSEDAHVLTAWWNDGKVMEHAGFPNGLSTNIISVQESLSKDNDLAHRRLIIELYDIPIGEMNYRNKGNNIAEIGIKICDASKHGKGFGKILLSMLIRALFNDYGYKKIVLDTNYNNKRAQHIYERLGFIKIKTNYNTWKNQIGKLQSSVDYELYRKEFNSFLEEKPDSTNI